MDGEPTKVVLSILLAGSCGSSFDWFVFGQLLFILVIINNIIEYKKDIQHIPLLHDLTLNNGKWVSGSYFQFGNDNTIE